MRRAGGLGGTDDELVAAANDGDRGALDTLLRRHYDRLHAVCRRIVLNDADALDATQECLISITRNIDRFDGRAAFTTWSYRIAVNASLDELRRRRRRPASPLPDDDRDSRPIAAPGGGLDSPDRVVDREVIEAALHHLPEDFRAAVVLRDLCGLDYAEIASVLDVPPGTVRSRIARGRAQLAGLLGNSSPTSERPTA
jgi:RNA polymerase sigma-70 factor (ECF subfamily)